MFIDEYRGEEDVSPESLLARAMGIPLERDRIKDPQAILYLAYGGARDIATRIQKANRQKKKT